MTEEKPGTNLLVNYLPKSWTDAELKNLFFQFGNVTACKVVRNRVTKESECYGFVRYDSQQAAQASIEGLSGYQVQNKRLKIQIAKPPTHGPERANLYIAGFPQDWSEVQLAEMVQPYGTTVDARVLYNYQTQKSRQCGFVRMKDYNEAIAVINACNGKTQQNGRALVVRFADKPRESAARKSLRFQQRYGQQAMGMGMGGAMGGGPFFGGPGGMGAGGMGAGGMGAGGMNPGMAPAGAMNPAMQTGMTPGMTPGMTGGDDGKGGQKQQHQGVCLFVYHLPPSAISSDLFQLFSNFGNVLSCKVMKDLQTGNSKGYGFVNMMNQFQAGLAIQALNGYRMGNKYLQVSYKT